MLEHYMQFWVKTRGKLELTYSLLKVFRSWNKSGGNSVKLLSCNHLCWNLKKRWSVWQNRFSFIKTVITALSYDHWGEGKKREKKKWNGKTSTDKAVGKGNAAALWKQFFFDSCIIWCTIKKITTYYLWLYNKTKWDAMQYEEIRFSILPYQ